MIVPILLQTLLIDPMDVLARIESGDRTSFYLELDEPSTLPAEIHVELDATVKRHGRGATAVLSANGIEFAMHGESYPAGGGRVRGVLEEVLPYDAPRGLSPVQGVVARLYVLTRTRRRWGRRVIDAVPRGRDSDELGPDEYGYVVELDVERPPR